MTCSLDDGDGASTGDGVCGAGGIDELGDGELAGAAVVVPGAGVVVVSDDGEFSSWLDGLGEPT